ncbi:MAG: uroporphyrinogen-III C-methyltransferase, partial [bacterium]|nr:uroporphyrinogen-III C-methyltransferase [bacterium]
MAGIEAEYFKYGSPWIVERGLGLGPAGGAWRMMDETFEAFCERIGPPPERAVSLIGVGPGDPGLISVRGALRLRCADVVVHDLHHCSPALWNLFDPDTERIYTGPTEQRPRMGTAEKTDLIRGHVEAGRRVVCLKGGDPFVFARGEQEVRALADAGIDVEVIPGPTSAIAGAAYAGIPLTDRDSTDAVSLAVGKGSRDPGIPEPELAAMVRTGTLAVYMGEENLEALCKQLIADRLAETTPVTIVEHATRPKQRVVGGTLANIAARTAEAGLARPAIAFVGDHAAVQEQMRWFDRRPLFGQRILITRPGHQASVLAGLLNSLGADVVEAPTVTIEPLADFAAVDDALTR